MLGSVTGERMTGYSREQFVRTVSSDYTNRRGAGNFAMFSNSSSRGSVFALEHKALGHPLSDALEVGQRRTVPLTLVFLDLTDFTGRTFWDDQDDVVDLAHAVLSGFVETVDQFGGYPLGLRGDGLFAGFGGPAELASAMALAASAFALDAVQNGVNPWLADRGMEPVQARAGLDAGDITFIRSGTSDHSEVNALGFAANFAAKCEKKANSWEIVVGQGVQSALPDYQYFSSHADSPKVYQRAGERRYYRFYDFAWRRALPHVVGVPAELSGVATADVVTGGIR